MQRLKNLGTDKYDFRSRYFAPWVGIPEDPVTGSAHTVLAPYWSKILQKVMILLLSIYIFSFYSIYLHDINIRYSISNVLSQDSLFAHQSSARGGELWLKVVNGPIREDGSGGGGITIIRGEGAVVLEGNIFISSS